MFPWGKPDLTIKEAERVSVANVLLVNFLTLCEIIAQRGGYYILEHPEKPGENWMASIWATALVMNFETRTRGARVHLHQCMFGGATMKPTCLAPNLLFLAMISLLCDGGHVHETSQG